MLVRTPLAWIVASLASLGLLLTVGAATASLAPSSSLALALLLAGCLLGVLVLASAHPGSRLCGPATTRGPADSPLVSLSFDDGPDPDCTPTLLAALRATGARATFFLLVDRAEAHPELVAAIAREHEVALHGLSHHPWLTVWHPTRGAAELKQASQRLEKLCGHPVRWFRPPFGATSPRLAAAVAASGLSLAWCSLRTWDGGPSSAAALLKRCERARPGDVLLLHDGRPTTRDALPAVLAALSARGLRSVSMGELFGPERP